MFVTRNLPVIVAFLIAATASILAATYSVKLIEERSEIGVRDQLDSRGLTWAEVHANGLQVTLSGAAPTEALRFQARSAAGRIIDQARVIDLMSVEAAAEIAPPRFSLELLRNDAGLSAIGLIPASDDKEALMKAFLRLTQEESIADLLETAEYPVPNGWEDAMSYALGSLDRLPRAKVSVEAGRVSITAMAESVEEKADLEKALTRSAPPGLRLALNISAPRPVLTPFTLRFVSDAQGTRFDACSADDEASETRIIQAAFAAGLTGPGTCTIGMGVPSPRWGEAAEQAIGAIASLEGGTVTFSDADVTLVALEGTDPARFDRVVGELENALPDVFALHAILPKTEQLSQEIPEFVATRSPEGLVQLRGRLPNETNRELAASLARSLFGSGNVHTATRTDENLPRDWPVRVLTGLEALGMLSNGAITVTPDLVKISGNTGDTEANAKISQLLAEKLGQAAQFDISITYQEKLDPVASQPTAEECEAEIAGILSVRKITFEPGSATIDAAALGTMDDIAEVLKTCGPLRLEIQGHTDSQGRETMNLELSQARAQSVLNELRARRVLTASFSAKGYGETAPIADNKTEDGREVNRRIEFRLIRPEPIAVVPESTLDAVAEEDVTPDTEGAASE